MSASPSALPLPQELWCEQRGDSSLPGPGPRLQDLSIWVPGILIIILICFFTSVTTEQPVRPHGTQFLRPGLAALHTSMGPWDYFGETTSCDTQEEVSMFCV